MAGHINFAEFDPFDGWAWKKLRLVMQELEDVHFREVEAVNFHYYTRMSASVWVSKESGAACVQEAADARRRLRAAWLPWVPVENDGADNASLADRHKQMFGSPGEPRYEAMIAELLNDDRKSLSPEEREAQRIRREAAAIRAAKGNR